MPKLAPVWVVIVLTTGASALEPDLIIEKERRNAGAWPRDWQEASADILIDDVQVSVAHNSHNLVFLCQYLYIRVKR